MFDMLRNCSDITESDIIDLAPDEKVTRFDYFSMLRNANDNNNNINSLFTTVSGYGCADMAHVIGDSVEEAHICWD